MLVSPLSVCLSMGLGKSRNVAEGDEIGCCGGGWSMGG